MQTTRSKDGVPIRYESIHNKNIKKVECKLPICCYVPNNKYAWFLLFIFVYLIFQSLVLFLFTRKHGIVKTVTQIKTIPTSSQWETYLKVLSNNDDGDFCRMSLISYLHPPDQHTVALLSMRGSGGTFVRHLVQQSTRVWTGTEPPCLILNQFGGYFDGECATPYHYKHFALTRFTSPSAITKEIGYYPTKIIHLVRNPFKSVISAYRYHLGCEIENVNGIGCNNRVLTQEDFAKPIWLPFAERHAEEWAMQFTYVKTTNVLRVYFEDLVNASIPEMRGILNFIANPLMVNPNKALECTSRMNNPGMETMDVTQRKENKDSFNNVFTVEILLRMCVYIKEHFNQTKLINNYC